MLINTQWLLEYLEPQCTHEDLLEVLPRVGLEIEESHALNTALKDVRIGFIREKNPLPDAAGMYACQIEVEKGRIVPVVCASEHEVQVGWGVPVAEAGTKLPSGRTIIAGQFHGVHSQGMICLDGELGMLAFGSGLQVFQDEAALGQPLPSVIRISEHLAELNVLPNRPDCLGLIGIAREVAAILGLKLRYPTIPYRKASTAAPIVPVELCEPTLCSRYMCQVIRDVKVSSSPHWLKSRLQAAGMRPINNVVDVTNFVMYEWGQPLHAFDYDRLNGERIVVRKMRDDETLRLLSGATMDGRTSPLVIADAHRPVALAGVMGGRETETNESTVNVLLEAAHFDPVGIRKTVKSVDIGLETRGTASSYRFERGTDPNRMLEGALERASALIMDLAGGRMDDSATDEYPARREPQSFHLSSQLVSNYLGTEVDEATIRRSLERLEMVCSADLMVQAPTWRVDVNDPVVLIEDVARQVGYDSIPTRASGGMPTMGIRAVSDRLRQDVSQYLAVSGFLESRNPSLESPEASAMLSPSVGCDEIRISNPANREMSVVRSSLLPGLLRSAERNLHRGTTTVRLFEVDRVFLQQEGTPRDRWMAAVVGGGFVREYDWRSSETKIDFYDLKGTVENVLRSLGVRDVTFRPVTAAPFLSGAAADLIADGLVLGRIGELAQGVLDTGKMQFRAFAFELDLDILQKWYVEVPSARVLARTPAVTRDLAIVVGSEDVFGDIERAIQQSAGASLESIQLMDVYQGPQIAPGKKSLAFHLVLRDARRTLTAEDASQIITRVIDCLQDCFGAQLRV